MPTQAARAPAESPLDRALPGARPALLLLLLINLFNYMDRYVLAAVLPKIEIDLFPHDPYAKTKLGALTTAFVVCYLAGAPVFGWLADRLPRWRIVAAGVIAWSVAGGATGLAAGFWLLLLARCGVGLGEAAYGPAAPTMLADLFPGSRRARVFAVFYLAMPVGSALGGLLGGFVAGSDLGWRWAFYLSAAPGLALGLWCLGMREPPRRHDERVRLRDYKALLHNRSFVLDTLGMAALTFAVGGVGTWMVTYLYDRGATFRWDDQAVQAARHEAPDLPQAARARLRPLAGRVFGSREAFSRELRRRLSPGGWERYHSRLVEAARKGPTLRHIATVFGILMLAAGLTATLLGGAVADRLHKRWPGAYFLVSGVSLLLAIPCFLLVLLTDLPGSWVFLFLTAFCLSFTVGPTTTVLANVTRPSMRATAFAVNLFVIHACGDALSPLVLGAIGDRFGLETGFVVVTGICLVGALLWLWGARFLARDTARAGAAPEAGGAAVALAHG